MTIVAARAYHLDILDGVYNDFRDERGLREECEHGRTLGMDGKTLIHPSQIAPCNEVFSPTEEEVDWSRKIIATFRRPGNTTKGVIVVEGRIGAASPRYGRAHGLYCRVHPRDGSRLRLRV